MGLFRFAVATVGTLVLAFAEQPDQQAEACGYVQLPRLNVEVGHEGALPAGAIGVYFRPAGLRTEFKPSDIKFYSIDSKGRAKRARFSIQESEDKGRYFLSFGATRPGEHFRIDYQNTSAKVQISKLQLQPASELEMKVRVSKRGSASLATSSASSTFAPLWRYRYHFDGKQLAETPSSSHYLNLCGAPAARVGWHELAVDVWPAENPQLSRSKTVDVWIDCSLAQSNEHPSLSKDPTEHFVPLAIAQPGSESRP